MSSLANLDVYNNRHNPFARFDHMNSTPTLDAYNGFLQLCDMARTHNIKLTKNLLEAEQRAFMAIKNHEYVINKYSWQH